LPRRVFDAALSCSKLGCDLCVVIGGGGVSGMQPSQASLLPQDFDLLLGFGVN
jgi:hypothetical protein